DSLRSPRSSDDHTLVDTGNLQNQVELLRLSATNLNVFGQYREAARLHFKKVPSRTSIRELKRSISVCSRSSFQAFSGNESESGASYFGTLFVFHLSRDVGLSLSRRWW